MTYELAAVVGRLAQVSAGAVDTVYVRSVSMNQGGLETALTIVELLVGVAILGGLIALGPTLLRLRTVESRVTHLVKRVEDATRPVLHDVAEVTADLKEVTSSVKGDMARVSATVHSVSDTVEHAVAMTEERLTELNALLAVVQGEVEGLVIAGSALAQGIKWGARALRRRDGTELASDEVDAEETTPIRDTMEDIDGDTTISAEALAAGQRGPRIRPRARS